MGGRSNYSDRLLVLEIMKVQLALGVLKSTSGHLFNNYLLINDTDNTPITSMLPWKLSRNSLKSAPWLLHYGTRGTLSDNSEGQVLKTNSTEGSHNTYQKIVFQTNTYKISKHSIFECTHTCKKENFKSQKFKVYKLSLTQGCLGKRAHERMHGTATSITTAC